MDSKEMEKGLLIVDKDFCVISFNESFKIWYPQTEIGKKCYKSFYNFDEPCPHCRILSKDFRDAIMLNPTFGTWENSHMEPIELKDIGSCYSISTRLVDENIKKSKKRNDNVIYANQHILETNELWNTALNNMPNGYHRCDIDKDLTFLNVSDRFCEIIGYTRDEIISYFDNKFINLVHPDDVGQVLAFVAEINATGEKSYAQSVYRIKSRKGYLWVLDSTKFVMSGESAFYQGSITDVSDIIDVHKKDKENLFITENKINQYKKAIISGSNVIYEVNVSKDILEVANFYKDEKEIEISSVCDLEVPCSYKAYLASVIGRVTEDDRKIYYETNSLEYFKRCFDSGVLKWQLEYDTTSFDNHRVHLRKHYILTQNEHTGDIHALIVAKDLTEEEMAKKESEYKLKAQKKELSVALYNAEQRLKVIDGLCNEYGLVIYVDVERDLCIPYVLPKSLSRQYKIGEVVETPFSQLVPYFITKNISTGEKEQLLAKTAMDVVLNELSDKDTYQINFKMKEGRRVDHSQVRIVSIDDNKYEQVWAFRSIEHIVQEESKQQKILQNLLEESQKAEKAKTTFLLNMSHDIRTPMNAIIGFNTIAKGNIDNKEEALDALRKTDLASHHLLNLINEVLEMSRIESNKVQLHNQLVSVHDCYEQLKEMFSVSMKQQGIKFVSEFTGTVEYIYLDVTRVMQVATNLLGNALKFTKTGGKIIYSSRELEITDDGYAVFEIGVKDTGVGMSAEFQKRLFDAFEREENPTISAVPGTGLGLAISKNIATLLGGDLTCKSKKGKGSEFLFKFKAKIANNQDEIDKFNMQKLNCKPEDLDFSNTRLLIVEDNELNLEIAIKIVTRYGFLVDTASDGAIAVNKVKKSEPGYYDLILMDIQMPNMDGYTATTKIRHLKNKELASIPIIAMTANAFEEDRKKALEVGMNGHLAKPVNISKLINIIKMNVK